MLLSAEYMAGLLDGEGCIYIHKCTSPSNYKNHSYYRVEVFIANCHKGVLELVKKTTGTGSVYEQQAARVKAHGWQRQYRWGANAKSATAFLKKVAPFSIIKKPYIDLALEFLGITKAGSVRNEKAQARLYKRYVAMRSKEVKTRMYFARTDKKPK